MVRYGRCAVSRVERGEKGWDGAHGIGELNAITRVPGVSDKGSDAHELGIHHQWPGGSGTVGVQEMWVPGAGYASECPLIGRRPSIAS